MFMSTPRDSSLMVERETGYLYFMKALQEILRGTSSWEPQPILSFLDYPEALLELLFNVQSSLQH